RRCGRRLSRHPWDRRQDRCPALELLRSDRKIPSNVLGEQRDLALLFKNLATQRTDAPLFKKVETMRWRGPGLGGSDESAAAAGAVQRATWSRIRPDDWRQSVPSILCAQLARHPTECAFRAGNKDRWFFRAIAPLIPFHTPSNRRTEFTSSVAEVASRFAGSQRLSQIAQRVARGR